ncbi:MAG: DNA primase [Rickettsiales bacterium]
MKFNPSLIERIRSAFLVSEVIGRRMPVKKHGREYQGLCPFHNEKTPSFTINDDKRFFHCFGCGAHGDAIEFVRRFERVSYGEAVKNLAREAGIEILAMTAQDSIKVKQEKNLYDVMEAACLWFERNLSGGNGIIARDYISGRGVKDETIHSFRIGYATENNSDLYNYLIKEGFSESLQKEAGLIIVPDNGRIYDRFRGRIMFPIRNSSGKVIAFGGRLINNSNKKLPKYLNSPETQLFKKGELLFNFDQAKKAAREHNTIVVMEGYMDVVMSVQAGVPYCVATLGTAVTDNHLRLLWQLVKEPIFCLDADNAGRRAMFRTADIALPLLKAGYSLRYASLPSGEDPDSYTRKYGKVGFEKTLFSAKRISQILWDSLSAKYDLTVAEEQAALDSDCQNIASRINDMTIRQYYLSYFRKQLWDRKKSNDSVAYKNKNLSVTRNNNVKKYRGKSTIEVDRSHHVEKFAGNNKEYLLESSVKKIMSVVAYYPDLLNRKEIEEFLSRIDAVSSDLINIRNIFLEAAVEVDLSDKDSFTKYINDNLYSDQMMEEIREYNIAESGGDSVKLWEAAVLPYEIIRLRNDQEKLQERIGIIGNDEYEIALSKLASIGEEIKQAEEKLGTLCGKDVDEYTDVA